MDKKIRERIAHLKVKALALDTSVVERYGFAFTRGLLAQVARVKQCGVAVLLPDVVANEIEAHLCAKATEASGNLLAAVQKVQKLGVLSAEVSAEQELANVAKIIVEATADRARQSLTSWIEAADIEVVDADDYVQVSDVTTLYFEGGAPFEGSGPKKHEFPDAIALLTLEGWADEYGPVLAVSTDKGWANYATNSDQVVVTQDLAGALAIFQEASAANASRALLASLADGDPLGLTPALVGALDRQGAIEFVVDADSQFEVRDAEAYPAFTEVEYPEAGNGNDDFEAVSFDDDVAIVRIKATVSVELECYLTFAKWDGSDKEYMDMGSAKLDEEEVIEIEALVTLTGRIPADMAIEHVEVLPQTVQIRIDDAEPDWMNAPRGPDDE
jgi:hypothetical protein